ncbi:hypothetical protein DERF_011945 [Dermatophagoides farinae]|uniref:Uncharacterized protein n=1 Tax=Dermatophagoides farinae TaxID=6954 RepID=A0A922KZJ1_DERFA|nr:hypothetical protein DERF_011945 [Dermatophagoides farinae]
MTVATTNTDSSSSSSSSSSTTEILNDYCPIQYDKEWFWIGIIIIIIIDLILIIFIGYFCCQTSIRRVREFSTTMTDDDGV